MSERLDVRTVIFDWGGTLAGVTREAENWARCSRRAAEVVAGTAPLEVAKAADLLHERYSTTLAASRKDPEHHEIDSRAILIDWGREIGLGSPDDWAVDRALDAFWTAWVGILDPIRGAAEVVAEVKARGYRIGLASNVSAPEPYALAELERMGLRAPLDSYALSSVVGYRKPHRAIYDAMLSGLREPGRPLEPHRVLFVGDGPIPDVEGPQRLGMRTALVRYEGLDWPAEEIRAARPDLRINHVRELLDVLPARQ
ncbi:MAG: HAD family hydrolase [Phycisphaerae bacterium]|nr:HAD family hydrolase [Phycisphaerae bacterium]